MHPVARSAAVLTGLVGINIAAQRSRLDPNVVVPASAMVLLAGARASGLSWDELGLGRAQARRGLVLAAVAAPATTAAVALLARHPSAAPFHADARYPTVREARRGALVTIPLAVAIPEEILFRSVLDASLRRHLSATGATATSAAAFGAWHALGAATLADDNAGVGSALGDSRHRAAIGVAGAVTATAIAGLGFTTLARATGSVLPGAAVHWALNATGAIAAGLRNPRAAYSGRNERPPD